MDLTALRDALSGAVRERGGFVARGWTRGESSIAVRVEEDDPTVWAALAAQARPPVLWVHESPAVDLPDFTWLLDDDYDEDLVPPDIAEKLGLLSESQTARLDGLKGQIRSMCKRPGVATLTLATLVDGVLYSGDYDADWVSEVQTQVEAVEDFFDSIDVPSHDPEHERAAQAALEREVIDALAADGDFRYCKTKTERSAYADLFITRFSDRDGFVGLIGSLGRIADLARIRCSAQEAAAKEALQKQAGRRKP